MENEKNEEKQTLAEEKLGIKKNIAEKEVKVDDIIEKEIPFDFDAQIEDTSTSAVEQDDSEVKEVKKIRKKVDLTKINIVDSTGLDKEKDLKTALYGGKSAFQVVCAQSGYMAKIIPLVHKDVISLLSSNLSRYEYRKAVFKVIYDKIVSISSEIMTFEEWLKNTSVEDVETFYYGIYCATFPNEGSFTFKCPKCGEERQMTINHNNLFKTTDKDKMRKLINEISKKSMSKEARKQFSLVGKTEAFTLDDSGIIVELRTPALWDSLEILRVVPDSVIDKDTASVTNMLYIKRFLIPSKSVKDGYSEQTDSQELLRIIDNLSINDAAELQEAVSDRVDSNRISYSIKNITCPNCHTEIKETPISIEDILFSLIFEKAQ